MDIQKLATCVGKPAKGTSAADNSSAAVVRDASDVLVPSDYAASSPNASTASASKHTVTASDEALVASEAKRVRTESTLSKAADAQPKTGDKFKASYILFHLASEYGEKWSVEGR